VVRAHVIVSPAAGRRRAAAGDGTGVPVWAIDADGHDRGGRMRSRPGSISWRMM